jgi:imidazolonepropionase-like amidohydrolase
MTSDLRLAIGDWRLGRTAVLLFFLAATWSCVPDSHVDLILYNGKIITVDADDTIAEAVLIRDGRLAAVGSDEEILALATPDILQVDLQGHTATPGLIDAHAHFG